jgi:hypothetical protein
MIRESRWSNRGLYEDRSSPRKETRAPVSQAVEPTADGKIFFTAQVCSSLSTFRVACRLA